MQAVPSVDLAVERALPTLDYPPTVLLLIPVFAGTMVDHLEGCTNLADI